MPTAPSASILAHFQHLDDPRISPATRHQLLDIVAIALCAVICGADSWVEVEAFGTAKQTWLRTFLTLPHGIPAHDTFGRVFAALDPVPDRGRVSFLGGHGGAADRRRGGRRRWQATAPLP